MICQMYLLYCQSHIKILKTANREMVIMFINCNKQKSSDFSKLLKYLKLFSSKRRQKFTANFSKTNSHILFFAIASHNNSIAVIDEFSLRSVA